MVLSVSSMSNVSTRERKDVRVNIKVKPSLRVKFRAVSIIDDVTMSDLINQFMRKKVYETESHDPERFMMALEQAKEEEEAERKIRKPNKASDIYDDLPQTKLFSDGTGRPLSQKRRSSAIQKDIEDATKDAIERTKRKKLPPKAK